MGTHKNIAISFELFPCKTPEGFDRLNNTCYELGKLNPKYFSVTFGACGSTQSKTQQVVNQLVKSNFSTTPHISCVNMTKERLSQMLDEYIKLGIDRLVVIQGDLSVENEHEKNDFNYANELVEYIRKITGDHFHINVAAYPEYHPRAKSPAIDLENFKRKVGAGADTAITQFFFNSDAYCRFRESCYKLNITVPIIPGIMPIDDYNKLLRFATACGAEIPLWLRKDLETHSDDPLAIKEIGIEMVTKLCERLLVDGVEGLHFYTLNQTEPTSAIIKNLGL